MDGSAYITRDSSGQTGKKGLFIAYIQFHPVWHTYNHLSRAVGTTILYILCPRQHTFSQVVQFACMPV